MNSALPKGDLPDFPFMVVKSNERMKIIGQAETTRTGTNKNCQYDFTDPVFDGSKVQRTRTSYYEENNTEVAPDDKPYLKKSEIDTKCIEAYSLAQNNKYLTDREFIYYNLSQSTSKKTFSISYQYKDEDDDIGSVKLNFKDPVIISDKEVSTKGYEVYSLNTGGIDVVIAPISIR